MSNDLAKWLEALGLGKYVDVFVENDVDLRTLPELTEDDLKELGLSLGHRRALQKAVGTFPKDGQEPSGLPVTPSPASGSDANLAAWERHPGERKPVTMLFADITGSTALTEKLDAEEAHDLLYGATQRMCEAVESNRGTVCRFMGDGMMAMFGAPMASEHHAVDACEAALEMQHAIRVYASGIKTGDANGLRIRVGLHSGEVVVLTVGEGDNVEYDASGPTVPIAARMEQAAEPGEVYITAATHSLAESRIEADTLEPITVKGVSEPVPIYALRRVRSAEEAVLDSARTPFVGRRAELNQFRGMLDTCIEEGHGQTVYVRGEPGIGKTRLVDEFTKIAAEKTVSTHRGLVLPFGVGKGRDAIRSLLRSLLGIAPGSGKAERQRATDKAQNDGRLEPGQAVFLNDLLDLPQPTKLRALYDAMDNTKRNTGKQAVVSALVSTTSSSQPILAIVEDVHWADAITLAHLSSFTKTVAECPALLVMTSRIEGDQLDRQWLSGTEGSPFFTIELGPLRKQDSITLIAEFIGSADPLAQRCLERAAGNPLFLEQLLRSVQEGTTESLPDSIQSLVLARMDRLEPEDKRALQAASVIGQRFDGEALCDLLEMEDYDCRELVEHNVVRPEGGGFLFTHALIQESVYGSLVKGQRRELHRKAARWFADSDLVLHAEHLALAGDEGAPGAFLEAAHEQAGHYRLEKALALVERGLELTTDEESFPLECLHGELLRSLGSPKESIEVYRKAKAGATSDIDRCRASVGIAEGLRIIDAYDELLEELQFIEVIANEHELSLELARVHQLRGGVHFFRGETEACVEANKVALQYAEAAGSPEIMAQTLSGLGDVEYLRGRLISAYRYFDRCIEISREQGLGKILAANLSMRGDGYRSKNDHAPALRDYEEAVSLAQETGQTRAEMIALFAGECLAEWGDLDEGERWLKRRLALARRLGSRSFVGRTLAELGRIAYMRGCRDQAEKLAQEAVDTLRDGGMAFAGAQALGVLALVTRNSERRRSALCEAEELLRGSSVSHNSLSFYPDAMETCLQTGQWDEVDRYAQALEDYTRAEPMPRSDLSIARGRALADFGRGKRDDATIQKLQRLRDEAERANLTVAIPALDKALSST
jgi:class 3 adenylate cyclase/tetratricopeptide (TPR) repeat protein